MPTLRCDPSGVYLIDGRIDGKRFRKSLKTRSREEAEEKFSIFLNGFKTLGTLLGDRSEPYTPAEIGELYRKTKERAKDRGIAFSLTREEFDEVFSRCQGRCEVTDLPFHKSFRPIGATKRPFAASVDRLDNAEGYSKDNIRIVCSVVNLALGEWGVGVLRRVAAALMLKEGLAL